jgi:hypothetical protein
MQAGLITCCRFWQLLLAMKHPLFMHSFPFFNPDFPNTDFLCIPFLSFFRSLFFCFSIREVNHEALYFFLSKHPLFMHSIPFFLPFFVLFLPSFLSSFLPFFVPFFPISEVNYESCC